MYEHFLLACTLVDFSLSAPTMLTFWFSMTRRDNLRINCPTTLRTDIHGPQRMNPKDSGDSLNVHVVSQAVTHPVKCLSSQWINMETVLYRHSWYPEDKSPI